LLPLPPLPPPTGAIPPFKPLAGFPIEPIPALLPPPPPLAL